jgi:hypothetical protein
MNLIHRKHAESKDQCVMHKAPRHDKMFKILNEKVHITHSKICSYVFYYIHVNEHILRACKSTIVNRVTHDRYSYGGESDEYP